MHWVVQDSEDEGEYNTLPLPTHSSISDFSTRDILLPTANKTSAISDFNTNDSLKLSNATTDSIADASISSVPVAKPKRPKPRPAYGRVLVADSSIASMSISAASVTANAINHISPGSLDGPGLGTAASLDSIERTDTRKRSATADASPAVSARSPIGTNFDAVVEGSSKDFLLVVSSDVEEDRVASERRSGSGRSLHSPDSRSLTRTHVQGSSARSPFDHPSSSIHPTRDPPPGEDTVNMHCMPPSSPFVPQRKKRRATDWNLDLEDSIEVEDKGSTTNEGPSAKKRKRSKEKKPRERKRKATSEDAAGSIATTSSTKTKKRESKKKEKVIEQEFKSKEYVEDSDDELLLEPKSSKTLSRTSPPDPASAAASVNASIDISIEPSAFAPTKTAVVSSSVLPSSSATVRASADVSELPSTDIPAPPPSPCGPVSETGKPRSEKKKKKRIKPVDGGEDEIPSRKEREAASASLHGTGGAIVEPQELTEAGKHTKKCQTLEPPVSLGEAEDQARLPGLDQSGSAEKDVPEAGKARSNVRKERKKRGTIVSSDEDEMEAENTRNTKRRDNNKENEPLSSPKNLSGKMPGSPSVPDSTVHAPYSNPKLQTTPKMPSRKDSMSALIRRVSAKVQSPLGTPSPACSPLAKVSRTVLSRIAPLHPNRRTPPPPPPRPPAPKKSKKMLELEEKWEEELAETVEGWSCMTDEERASLRRAKRDEYFGCED